MKINLTTDQRIVLCLSVFAVSVIGFMVKLPAVFRHSDKELHTAFYFFAAAFLNLLFAKTNLLRHMIIFFALYLFGIAIEYAQDYSNKLFHSRIHGRFDPEDVQSNLKGLIAFSFLWLIWMGVRLAFQKTALKEKASNPKVR